MPFDLFFTIGSVILVFAIPSVVSAFSDRHPPRAAILMVLIGGGLVLGAVTQKPGGYALTEIPDVYVRVAGHYLR